MRNYFSRALLFQQWITFRFPIIGFVFLWVIICRSETRNELSSLYQLAIYSQGFGEFGYGLSINSRLITYIIVFSAIIVMISMGRNKYNNFLFYGSQPITRKQFIATKGIFISVFAVAMMLIDYYVRVLNYLEHRNFYKAFNINYLSIVSIRTLIIIGFLLATIAFFFFIQGVYSNSIISSAIGVGAIFYIPSIFTIIHDSLSERFGVIKYYVYRISYYAELNYDSTLPDQGENKFAKWFSDFTYFKFINYQHYLLVLGLLLVTAALWIINLKIYNKIKIEKVGAIFHFRLSEKVLKVAMAIGLGLMSTVVIMFIIFGFGDVYWGTKQYYLRENVLAVLNILSLFTIPVIYKIEGKLLKRFVKN
ncbi:MAG: hypothetical protein AB6733_03595 [Clostridiaceae bacterium]